MDDRENVARVGCVAKAMKAFGIVDEDRIMAIVDLTCGIPWLVPPVRGEEYSPTPLFAAAVARAALGKTFGAPGPGDIMQAAVDIAGKTRSQSGHESQRPWVAKAMDPAIALGVESSELLEIGSNAMRRIG
jgi:hypothetical protein